MSPKHEDMGFVHNYLHHQQDDGRVLLLLHGTGGNEDDLLKIGEMLDKSASILAPRGKVLENGMPRYFRRIAPGLFDIKDLKFRTSELASFIRSSSKKYNFEVSSIISVGYSNGANIAASLLLLEPGFLNRVILFRPMIPLIPDKLPVLNGTKVFISGGEYDTAIPRESTLELGRLLERCGANVKMNWELAEHSLAVNEVSKARQWIFDGGST